MIFPLILQLGSIYSWYYDLVSLLCSIDHVDYSNFFVLFFPFQVCCFIIGFPSFFFSKLLITSCALFFFACRNYLRAIGIAQIALVGFVGILLMIKRLQVRLMHSNVYSVSTNVILPPSV